MPQRAIEMSVDYVGSRRRGRVDVAVSQRRSVYGTRRVRSLAEKQEQYADATNALAIARGASIRCSLIGTGLRLRWGGSGEEVGDGGWAPVSAGSG